MSNIETAQLTSPGGDDLIMDLLMTLSQDFCDPINDPDIPVADLLIEDFNMVQLYDILMGTERGTLNMHGLAEDSMRLLAAPDNEKSRKIRQQYHRMLENTYWNKQIEVMMRISSSIFLVPYTLATYTLLVHFGASLAAYAAIFWSRRKQT